MDLRLYGRVLWRFKLIVVAGFLFAAGLAVLSVVRVDPGGSPAVKYREHEQWASFAMLFVTQQGFPWGRLTTAPVGTSSDNKVGFESEARFANLAQLYAYLASSDPVHKLILKKGPLAPGEEIAAEPVMSSGTFAAPLPLVRLIAVATTPERSHVLVIRATDAFRQYLEIEQARHKIGDDSRVLVTVVRRADDPKLLAGRSMTLPIVVFMGVMILVSGLCFVLDNMLGRGRKEAAREKAESPPVAAARDAA